MKRGAERNDKESDQNERHRGRNKVREHQEQPIHLASANTLSCHCERELVHSSDSLKHCRRGERGGREGGRARNGEGDFTVRCGKEGGSQKVGGGKDATRRRNGRSSGA